MSAYILVVLAVIGFVFWIDSNVSANSIQEYHKSIAEKYSDRISTDGEYFKDRFGVCYVGHNIGARDSFLASVPCDKVGL